MSQIIREKKNNTLNENKEWIVIWNVSLEATKFAYLWPRKKGDTN